jgi:tRNA dimethylallyltransferase
MHVDDGSRNRSGKIATTNLQGKPDENDSLLETKCFPSLADRAMVLTGPTASGKSSIAIALAKRVGAEIISLDSIAVYRYMDIGTAKPNAEDQQRVTHHMIDIVNPDRMFSVACYLESAHAVLDELQRRGRRAIFVGGTPMYLKGVLRGFDPGPPADWKFRQSVEDDLALHGIEALRERLRQVDPLAEHRINEHDTRRMIRALEVAWLTGVPLSHRQMQFDQQRPADRCQAFVIQMPREQLHQRINSRVDQMFDQGLVDEVRKLISDYGPISRTASQAVGYREVIDWLQKGGDLSVAIEEVAAHTRRLARRQETWFRSFTELTPIEIQDGYDPNQVAEEIAARI